MGLAFLVPSLSISPLLGLPAQAAAGRVLCQVRGHQLHCGGQGCCALRTNALGQTVGETSS